MRWAFCAPMSSPGVLRPRTSSAWSDMLVAGFARIQLPSKRLRPQGFPRPRGRDRAVGKIGKKLPFPTTGCRRTFRATSLGAWNTVFPHRPIMLFACSRRPRRAIKFLS